MDWKAESWVRGPRVRECYLIETLASVVAGWLEAEVFVTCIQTSAKLASSLTAAGTVILPTMTNMLSAPMKSGIIS